MTGFARDLQHADGLVIENMKCFSAAGIQPRSRFRIEAKVQGSLVLLRMKDLVMRQRILLLNPARGLLATFHVIAPQSAYEAIQLI